MLEGEFGIDFTHYKPSTVTRRIERRLALTRAEDLATYIERLRDRREELDVLYRDLLIGVTRFFRNEQAFAVLEQQVLPDLLRRGPCDAPFRAWVAGCATGEEAYSLAITMQEALGSVGGRPVKIFATDVHPGSLDVAARGVYGEEALANVPRDRIERYFHRSGRTYQIVPEIRQMVVFAPHNVIRDAPFTRMDLVSCRNMLIYLKPAAQQKAFSLFHFALNRGGLLFLGPSESPGQVAQDYETIDKHWRIYRKASEVRVSVDPRLQPLPRATMHESRALPPAAKAPFGRYALSHLLGTYDALLSEHMPPSLLVDDHGELVHAFAGASRFLKPRDGRQGLDVAELVDPELKMALAGGLKRALADAPAVVFNGMVLGEGDDRAVYKVTMRRVATRAGSPAHVLVAFERLDSPVPPPRSEPPETQFDMARVSREQLGVLEAELTSTRENLQAAIEELEASNEEFQASNEELLAANEELQSTNEELQSVNEELYTVNAEHQRKISELVELTNDMDNLLASTEIGTIFLDEQLRIRKFTPQVAQMLRLLPQDVGRPIETFAHTMRLAPLMDDLRRCLATGERVEHELARDALGRSFYLRILPYRARGVIGGVVLTFMDIDRLSAAHQKIREAVQRRDQFLAMLSHELRNPLSAIVTATRLLRTAGDPQGRTRFVETLERQSMQMARLLDDLLEASRVTQNKIELRRRVVDLRVVSRDAVDAVRTLADERGLQVATDIDGQPLLVDGDPARLQQIQVNLLNNALKYTPRGGHIALSVAREGERAVVRVRDDGVGIPPEMLESVFELFVQSQRTLARADGGIGVGLTLVKALVELHGGSVSAHSDGSGKGSEFVASLPLCGGDSTETGSSRRPRLAPGRGAKVVVVEDNDDSRQMLTMYLESAGFPCLSASNGLQALALMDRGDADVAIVDLGLPDMDGLELARRMRKDDRFAHTCLIALTGYGQPTDREAVRDAGFDEHMVKPVNLEELLAKLGAGAA
jgi:two-component system CheB/CheR fusion protein